MLLPLGRDRTVEDAVGIACDGGHGGFQLMGHIGDKVAALPLRLRQGVCHGVKGLRQLAHLIGAVQFGDTHIEIAVGIGTGSPHHVGDGLNLPHGGKGADREGDQQNGGENNEEQAHKGPPHGQHCRLVHEGHHNTQQLAPCIVHGNAHRQLFIAIDAADVTASLIEGLGR